MIDSQYGNHNHDCDSANGINVGSPLRFTVAFRASALKEDAAQAREHGEHDRCGDVVNIRHYLLVCPTAAGEEGYAESGQRGDLAK